VNEEVPGPVRAAEGVLFIGRAQEKARVFRIVQEEKPAERPALSVDHSVASAWSAKWWSGCLTRLGPKTRRSGYACALSIPAAPAQMPGELSRRQGYPRIWDLENHRG